MAKPATTKSEKNSKTQTDKSTWKRDSKKLEEKTKQSFLANDDEDDCMSNDTDLLLDADAQSEEDENDAISSLH